MKQLVKDRIINKVYGNQKHHYFDKEEISTMLKYIEDYEDAHEFRLYEIYDCPSVEALALQARIAYEVWKNREMIEGACNYLTCYNFLLESEEIKNAYKNLFKETKNDPRL